MQNGIHFKLKWYFSLFALGCSLIFLDVVLNNSNIIGKAKQITIPLIRHYYNDKLITLHHQLARHLLQAEEDLVNKKDADAIVKLRSVMSLLDIRYQFNDLPDSISLTENDIKKTQESNSMKTYSEYNPNLSVDYTNLNSIFVSSSTIDLSNFVTILIDDCERTSEGSRKTRVLRLISDIRNQYSSVRVLLATDYANVKELAALQGINKVKIIGIACDNWNRAPLQNFLSYTMTSHVLFLSSATAVTSDLNITRLLMVATDVKGIGIVGMSERGIDGGWDYTCAQILLRNAHLSVHDGYKYSRESCLFCDITSNNFLAATKVLLETLPDSSLPSGPREIDWGIRLQKIDILTVTCPDVMIHTNNIIMKTVESDNNHSSNNKKSKESYLALKRLHIKLAQKYELNSIDLGRTRFQYSCTEINYECKARSRTRKYMLPPCCLKQKQDKLKQFLLQAQNILVAHRLEAGSVLGAVKFKGSIPWDFDDDITFQYFNATNFKKLIRELINTGILENSTDLTERNDIYTYFQIERIGEFRFDDWPNNYTSYVYNINNNYTDATSSNIPCLLFGYFPIVLKDYKESTKNQTNQILKNLWKEKSKLIPKLNVKEYCSPDITNKCFLFSKVRVGKLWVSAPMNPGKHVLGAYGPDLFKHAVHWRFKRVTDVAWPKCLLHGHPMCLDIHPTDGNIPFL